MDTALEACVGDVDDFLKNTLSQRPLHRPGAFPVDRLPITVSDVDEALMSRPIWAESVRVAKDNDALDRRLYTLRTGASYVGPRNVVDPVRVAQLVRSGATVVLRPASLYIPALKRFCKEIEAVFGHGVDADVFITPANSRGFEIHADAAESLAIQLSGTKYWTLYEPIRPLEQRSYGATPPDDLTPVEEITMETGDFLYVPRGMPHLVRSGDSPSVHLTVSVNTATWPDLLSTLVDGALGRPELKKLLPMGAYVLDDIREELPKQLEALADMVRQTTEGVGLEQVLRSMDGYAYGLHDGVLSQVLGLTTPGPDTVVRLRPAAWPVVEIGADGDASLQTAGNRFRVEPDVVRACERLQQGPVPVTALAADPDVAQNAVQVLLRLGVAEVVPD